VATAAVLVALTLPAPAQAQATKPNILVIFGDDVGQTNISAYAHGVVGYKTPNIDRIAKEGLMFTAYYAENSCTAGRSSFITGQTPLRTGLSKVGIPGAAVGIQKGDITIARALKALGYATGQFGKNHLGDKDEYLPTNHGSCRLSRDAPLAAVRILQAVGKRRACCRDVMGPGRPGTRTGWAESGWPSGRDGRPRVRGASPRVAGLALPEQAPETDALEHADPLGEGIEWVDERGRVAQACRAGGPDALGTGA
jgi:Sulfatase